MLDLHHIRVSASELHARKTENENETPHHTTPLFSFAMLTLLLAGVAGLIRAVEPPNPLGPQPADSQPPPAPTGRPAWATPDDLDDLDNIEDVPTRHRKDRVIVRMKPQATPDKLLNAHPAGARVHRAYDNRIHVIDLPPDTTVGEALQRYRRSGLVEYAQPDFELRAFVTPNDTHFATQWALHNTGQSGGTPDADIDALEGWDVQSQAPSIIVAVVDTGARG